MNPRIVQLDEIAAVIDRRGVINAVRTGLIAHARGLVQSPMPGHLDFSEPRGDCHIKFGHLQGDPFYVVKIASGGYENERFGLPVNDGVVIVLSAVTGQIATILLEQGWLTAWRTAAAGALAAEALAPKDAEVIGVFGSGIQARLQVEWLRDVIPCRRVVVWARRPEKAVELCRQLQTSGFDAEAVVAPGDVVRRARVVVMATAATAALFATSDLQPGTHLTALGADSPGKQELDPACFARAACIVTDDHRQCLALGDFGVAVRAGAVSADVDVSLGSLLGGDAVYRRKPGDITIADLTGLAAQDIAIASWVAERLAASTTQPST
jgi:ornithine cyclodeaminase